MFAILRNVKLALLAGVTVGACAGSHASSASPRGKPLAASQPPEIDGDAVFEVAPPRGTIAPDSTKPLPSSRGTAPAISTVSDASAALGHGWYTAVEAFLRGRATADSDESRALWARVFLATGRYDEVLPLWQTGQVHGAQAHLAVERAEAHAARGLLPRAAELLTLSTKKPGSHRAVVLLARVLALQGRQVEAEAQYMRLIDAYNEGAIGSDDAEGLTYVGMAARALGSPQDANDAFREAARADPERVETQVEWAKLFLDKHDLGHAEESLRAALAVNPNCAEAHALMARLRIEQSFDFEGATAYAERALEVNPNLTAAHVELAGVHLMDLNFGEANRWLDRALAVNANDLSALSVRAAALLLANDEAGFERAKNEVLRRNRHFSEMYRIIARFGDWEHRYPSLVKMARQALAMNPEDAAAHATLGINLLRAGEEAEGLAALRESWQRDRFNVQVYNTLNLYDDVITSQYEEVSRDPFVFRFHREERPVLERVVPSLLQGAYRDMRRRYAFRPRGPVRIEMFQNPEHYSVRTTGLPNLGVQGVCFGKVVTALSPGAAEFNWGQIVWHELSHVFHIQLSKNRVPRWFTEGLAEYETVIARPEWRREHDQELWVALRDDRLPPLRFLNRAFTHARSPQEMTVAYYLSVQVARYIVERFGFDRVVAMLRGWGEGLPTEEVFTRALGVTVEEVERGFRAQERKRLASRATRFDFDLQKYGDLEDRKKAAQSAPRDATRQAALAAALWVTGDARGAEETAKRALSILSTEPVAHVVLVQVAFRKRDWKGAARHLRALIEAGNDGYEVRLARAQVAFRQRQGRRFRQELEAATELDGARPEAWQGLVQHARRARDERLLMRALSRLADVDQHDRGTWRALLDLLAKAGRWDAVVSRGQSAVLLDPFHPDVHRLLAEGYLHTRRPRQAIEALDTALLANPESPGPLHLGRARAYLALRRLREARQAADRAVAADPALQKKVHELLRGR